MSEPIYHFKFDPSLKMMNKLNQIDRFDAAWTSIERRQSGVLKHLRSIATVKSVGASTRIEGATMSDQEVELFLNQLDVKKLEDRNQEEVAGYFHVLDQIVDEHTNIRVGENEIKGLHKWMMQYSKNEEWHRGEYKQHPNSIEQTRPDGTKITIFETTPPGYATDDSMRELYSWYREENELIPVIRVAVFIYEFLSIHPFQDGNGRLSRLLTTLLMLKQGYTWIQYVSFEHEIENRKSEYYKVLMQTQKNRPGENLTAWVNFFADCLISLQQKLDEKIKAPEANTKLSKTEESIIKYLSLHPGSKSSQVAEKLQVGIPTVKKVLSNLLNQNLIIKTGLGKATSYWYESNDAEKNNLMFTLDAANKVYEFELLKPINSVRIHRVILVPNFEWHAPTEWAQRAAKANLRFVITLEFMNERFVRQYHITGWISPFHYQPVFELTPAIEIPASMVNKKIFNNQYPVRIKIDLNADSGMEDFKVHFVYDAIL